MQPVIRINSTSDASAGTAQINGLDHTRGVSLQQKTGFTPFEISATVRTRSLSSALSCAVSFHNWSRPARVDADPLGTDVQRTQPGTQP